MALDYTSFATERPQELAQAIAIIQSSISSNVVHRGVAEGPMLLRLWSTDTSFEYQNVASLSHFGLVISSSQRWDKLVDNETSRYSIQVYVSQRD